MPRRLEASGHLSSWYRPAFYNKCFEPPLTCRCLTVYIATSQHQVWKAYEPQYVRYVHYGSNTLHLYFGHPLIGPDCWPLG